MCAARNQTLLEELRQYRKDYVEIPQCEQTRAKKVVEEIKRGLQDYSNNESPPRYNFGRIFHQGSIYERLKVIKADEFDLLVPLNLKDQDWAIATSSEQGTSGYYMIEKQQSSAVSTWEKLTEGGRLIPDKVRHNMQSTVQKAVNTMTNLPFSIKLSYTGPAITLRVDYDRGKKLSIDIVPCVQLEDRVQLKDRSFVAKSPKSPSGTPTSNVYDRMWRESFSEQEKNEINKMDGMNECRRDCLKILKTIQKRRGKSQIGMLSSYYMKTCLLHLDREQRKKKDPDLVWDEKHMADRFKGLLNRLIEFFNKRDMPNFFCPSVNLFDQYLNPPEKLNNILRWLKGVTKDDESIINCLLHERDFMKPTPDNFEIFVVNTDGKTKTYPNMQRSTTVKQLKVKIYEKEGIPVDQQRLTFESRPLQDGQTLGYYDIQQESTIYLLLRLRGG